MTSKETVLAFIEAINSHDVNSLAGLMTGDHRFIDAHGNQVVWREDTRSCLNESHPPFTSGARCSGI